MQFQYHRILAGDAVLTTFDVDSVVLQGNPLDDPTLRSQPMLLPQGDDFTSLPLEFTYCEPPSLVSQAGHTKTAGLISPD